MRMWTSPRQRRSGPKSRTNSSDAESFRNQRRRRMISSLEGDTMNKKFIIAWAVVFVVWFMGSFVVHGVLLRSDYMELTGLFRPEGDQQKYLPLMILAHAIYSLAFIWIYARGAE